MRAAALRCIPPALLAGLALSVLAGDPLQEALRADDQCAAGDAACVLSALQRRGDRLAGPAGGASGPLTPAAELAELEAVSASGRRRRHGGQNNDISKKAEKHLIRHAKGMQKAILALHANLTELSKKVNATRKMVETDPPQEAEMLQMARKPHHHHKHKKVSGAPPRERAVQKWLTAMQGELDSLWKELSYNDRLLQWANGKILHPDSTDPFVEKPEQDEDEDKDEDEEDDEDYEEDDEDDEELLQSEAGAAEEAGHHPKHKKHKKPPNPAETRLVKDLKDQEKQIKGVGKEIKRVSEERTSVLKLYKQTKAKQMPGARHAGAQQAGAQREEEEEEEDDDS